MPLEAVQPCVEFVCPLDREHRTNVIERLHRVNSGAWLLTTAAGVGAGGTAINVDADPFGYSLEDQVRLLHMIEAADEAMSFIAGHTPSGLASDRKTLFAVIRCIEIIGEAAARASDATRNTAPDVPWSVIVGMRNRLVHAYFDVDADLVWKTTSVELPVLKVRLQALI